MTKDEKKEESRENQIRYRNIILSIICILLITSNTFFNVPVAQSDDTNCIVDRSFISSKKISQQIRKSDFLRRILVIISSLLIDYSVFSLFYGWILYGKSWRTLISSLLFYALRGISNSLYQLQSPTELIWEFPGIWSFSVSYHPTTDFFFSGHVGINLISAIESFRLGLPLMGIISSFGVFFQIFVMVNVRGHYFIDIIAGLISAHYSILMSDHIQKYLDYYLYDLDDEKDDKKLNSKEN